MSARLIALDLHSHCRLEPTADQVRALDVLAPVLSPTDTQARIGILLGAAGTGKTTLMQALVSWANAAERNTVLLAPTGRAAKVLGRTAGAPASTIHKHIYTAETGRDGLVSFRARTNDDDEGTLYIVDEASMIADGEADGTFGRRRLLADLVRYCLEGAATNGLIFVGDPAQLPPVGLTVSPALDEAYLRSHFGYQPCQAELTEVKRQGAASGILTNAQALRQVLYNPTAQAVNHTHLRRFDDVVVITDPHEVLDRYCTLYHPQEPERVLLIANSNRMAVRLNRAIRQRLCEDDPEAEPLQVREPVMVVKNFYQKSFHHLPFLANGEVGQVLGVYPADPEGDDYDDAHLAHARYPYEPLPDDEPAIGPDGQPIAPAAGGRGPQHGPPPKPKLRYGQAWRRVEVAFETPDGQEEVVNSLVPVSLLTAPTPALSLQDQQQIYHARLAARSAQKLGVKKSDLQTDPYIAALQLKYGYAITGHKSQGGQWDEVIIVFEPFQKQALQGGNLADAVAFLRWTYTALTRASRTVRLFMCPLPVEG